MQLLECLSSLPRTRRAQGLRTTDEQILVMVILSYICGYTSYRTISSYCKAHEKQLRSELNLKHPVPCHVTFKTVLDRFDTEVLVAAFNKWANFSSQITDEEVISIDGKVLKSTVSNPHNSKQDFVSVVSLFSQKTNLVLAVSADRNQKKHEIATALDLIKQQDKKNLLFTLDAQHCQKKL
jgi:hypothetical protein